MAFSETELQKYKKLAAAFVKKRRPPLEIRDKLDIGFRIKGQSLEIFEIRPRFMVPQERTESPIAKATYVRTQDIWKVYWMRRDLKWHGYNPKPEVKKLESFLKLVDEDKWRCFWG